MCAVLFYAMRAVCAYGVLRRIDDDRCSDGCDGGDGCDGSDDIQRPTIINLSIIDLTRE